MEDEEKASVCCREIKKLDDLRLTSPEEAECITKHEGFGPNCLNRWVLDAIYCHYRVHYGPQDGSPNE